MFVYPCTGLNTNCVPPFSGPQKQTQMEDLSILEPCRSSQPSMLIKITSGGVWVCFFKFLLHKTTKSYQLFSGPRREMAK